jgi:hypothetical protein
VFSVLLFFSKAAEQLLNMQFICAMLKSNTCPDAGLSQSMAAALCVSPCNTKT